MNIQQKFITALLSIGLVPTLVVSLVSFFTISTQLNQRTQSQLASIDIKQQQAISALLQAKQQEVIKLAEEYDFQVALQQLLTSPTAASQNAVVGILNSRLSEVSGLQYIHVANQGGTIIASTESGQSGQELPNKPSASATYQGPDIAVVADPSSGLQELYITTSLSINDQYQAILRAVYSVNDLVAELGDYTGLGSTGETVITAPGSDGRQVSLFPLRFNTSASDIVPYSVVRGQDVNYTGHPVMVSSRPIGFSDWTIGTMIETGEALAPIAALRNALIVILILSTLAIMCLAWYLARLFTNPILRIAEASKRIGMGDFSVPVEVTSGDEIGVLASSINTMRESLKAFVTGIESQRNHLAIILDTTTDSILAVLQDGTITTANRAALELAGKPASAIIGRSIHDIFAFTSNQTPFAIDFASPGSNTYSNIEYVGTTGSRHYLKLIVARLAGTELQPGQAIITIRDETKSREFESMKLDFVSMAAHELRTPLAAIRGYIELITFKLKKAPPDISNYLAQALKSSVELSSLINNLLDVSRIERGTLTLNMEKTDLAASVAKAIKDVGFQAKERNMNVSYGGPDHDNFVVADEIALREVITNLLTNAVKYTQPGGHIEASLTDSGDRYTVAVKDNGVGIPKAAQPHLFTKFFRVHGGLDSGSTGTGLGLFIAKSIIERHDGTIWVESEEGKGSTFSFTIPKLTEERLAGLQSDQAEGNVVRRRRGWITKNTTR